MEADVPIVDLCGRLFRSDTPKARAQCVAQVRGRRTFNWAGLAGTDLPNQSEVLAPVAFPIRGRFGMAALECPA